MVFHPPASRGSVSGSGLIPSAFVTAVWCITGCQGQLGRALERSCTVRGIAFEGRDIDTLDRRILHLVRERIDLAREIGDLKPQCHIPLRNFEVEEQVHRRFENACSDLGLDAQLGRELALCAEQFDLERLLLGEARSDEIEA